METEIAENRVEETLAMQTAQARELAELALALNSVVGFSAPGMIIKVKRRGSSSNRLWGDP